MGYHIWPNEVIAEIRRRNIATIAGNHDLKVIGLQTTASDLDEGGKKYAYHIIEDAGGNYIITHLHKLYQSFD